MRAEIYPGILTHTLEEYMARLEMAEQGGSEWAHLDIMDGQFVQNITVMPHEVAGISTTLKLEAHLMAYQPERYFSDLTVIGCQRVLLHRECYPSLEEAAAALKHAADYFPETGLALSPETGIERLAGIPASVVMLMGVHPGSGGQAFIEEVHGRIREVAAQKLGIPIEVDGGVDEENIRELRKDGASRFVINTHIFLTANVGQSVQHFIQLVSGGS